MRHEVKRGLPREHERAFAHGRSIGLHKLEAVVVVLILRGRELPAQRLGGPGERAAILVHEPVREPRQARELVDERRRVGLAVRQFRAEPQLRARRQQRVQQRRLGCEIARQQRRAQLAKLRRFHRLEIRRARAPPLHPRRVIFKAQPQIAHIRRRRQRARLEIRQQPFPAVHRAPAPPLADALRERPRIAQRQHEFRHRDPFLVQPQNEVQPEIENIVRQARPQLQPLPAIARAGQTQRRQIAPLHAALRARLGEKDFEPRDERGLRSQQFAPERPGQPPRECAIGRELRFSRGFGRGRRGFSRLRQHRPQQRVGVLAILLHRATAQPIPHVLARREHDLGEIRFRAAHLTLETGLARNFAHAPHHAAREIIFAALLRGGRQSAEKFPRSVFEGR